MGEPSRNGPRLSHVAHWGSFSTRWDDDRLGVTSRPGDPDPSPILGLDRLAGELRRVSDARLFKARGACLAAARLDDGVMQGVVHLPTGAWYDPWPGDGDRPTCVHGNPNVLTRDLGTSRLAQGSCGQVTTIQCERFTGDAPAVRAHEPPASSLAL